METFFPILYKGFCLFMSTNVLRVLLLPKIVIETSPLWQYCQRLFRSPSFMRMLTSWMAEQCIKGMGGSGLLHSYLPPFLSLCPLVVVAGRHNLGSKGQIRWHMSSCRASQTGILRNRCSLFIDWTLFYSSIPRLGKVIPRDFTVS